MKLYYKPGTVEELVLISEGVAIYWNSNHPVVINKDYSGPYLSKCDWYNPDISIESQIKNLKGYTFIGDV